MTQEINAILANLSAEQQSELFLALFSRLLGDCDQERTIVDRQGKTLGYFLPPAVRTQLASDDEAQQELLASIEAGKSRLYSREQMLERLKAKTSQ